MVVVTLYCFYLLQNKSYVYKEVETRAKHKVQINGVFFTILLRLAITYKSSFKPSGTSDGYFLGQPSLLNTWSENKAVNQIKTMSIKHF